MIYLSGRKEKGKTLNVLVIGPCPPPDGGVATFVKSSIPILLGQEDLGITLHRVGSGLSTPPFLQLLIDYRRMVILLLTSQLHNMQIFHIHSSSYWSFFRSTQYVFLIRLFSRGKIVFHLHGGEFEKFFTRLSRPLKRVVGWTLKSSDHIIVTSPTWIPVVRRLCRTVPVSSVHNGYDPEKFYPANNKETRAILGLPDDKVVLVSIGYLELVKGHEYLIESLKDLVKHKNNLLLYIIGEGSQRDRLARLVKTNGLEEHVFFMGKQPHESIPLWINACDLFILPSVSEGCPVVMFECLGCGRPFIGTRVGGVPDIIIGDEYGLLCDPMDSKALARIIEVGLEKKWDYDAIASYSENFTWERITEDLLTIYRRLGAEPGRKDHR